MKHIPTGIEDFDRIILEDYYYIDKSDYIRTMEEYGSYILLVRPRRMGKSLFSSMAMSYYDLGKKDMFDRLFGSLKIGAAPTRWASSFLVLKFDFSKVGNDLERLPEMFHNYCFVALDDFFRRYGEIFTPEEVAKVMSRAIIKDAIVTLISIAKAKGLRTYLFIDEYDNFTNTVLAARGIDAHNNITHGEGFYRDFFKCCKGTFDRILMTGVTPVTYDDLTSGFSIVDIVSLSPTFNCTIGISDTELRQMIGYYQSEGRISMTTESIIQDLKPWYDNFCFSEDCYGIDPPMYNTYSVMRYLKELVNTQRPPRIMVDRAARTEPQKLDYLVMSEDLYNREERIGTIKEICANGYTTGNVADQFPASECGTKANFKSMLYYFGTLTYGGVDENGEMILRVPNRNMGELYLSYLLDIVEKEGYTPNRKSDALQQDIKEAALTGRWQPMIEKIGEIYSEYSSVRNGIRSEHDAQGFIRGLLCLNNYYEIWPELELGHGFCDILLLPKMAEQCPTKHSYIIEIKCMKSGNTNVEAKIAEACSQLDRYVSDHRLTYSPLLKATLLTKLYIVFQGKRMVACGEHQ